MTTESCAINNQPVIGDQRQVLTHGSVHATAHHCRTYLDDVGRTSDELQAGVAGAALPGFLVSDQVAIGQNDLKAYGRV